MAKEKKEKKKGSCLKYALITIVCFIVIAFACFSGDTDESKETAAPQTETVITTPESEKDSK